MRRETWQSPYPPGCLKRRRLHPTRLAIGPPPLPALTQLPVSTLRATEPPSYDLTLATSAGSSPPGRLTEVGNGRVWIARWMASTIVRSQTMDSCTGGTGTISDRLG
eukprot:scaffold78524_cov45-Phaeocystis_antarctica.AAC.1